MRAAQMVGRAMRIFMGFLLLFAPKMARFWTIKKDQEWE
jgi:hypothetical protein